MADVEKLCCFLESTDALNTPQSVKKYITLSLTVVMFCARRKGCNAAADETNAPVARSML